MAEVYIIEALRTPIGIGKPEVGHLHPVAPVDLAAGLILRLIANTGIAPEILDDVILGCVTPIGDQGANIARLSTLQAGLPVSIPGVQLNRMCGSGQQAVHFAAQAILAGDMDLVIAGGVEMLSREPLGSDWPKAWPDDFPFELVHQGLSAEMMAERWDLSRDELDDYACESHLRAAEAIRSGRITKQISPVAVQHNGKTSIVEVDQGVRMEPDRQKMGSLKPVFKQDGVITAANSSQISDGAAGLLIASEKALADYGLEPMARIVTRVVVGTDPVLMLEGPIPATQRALQRSELTVDDIAVYEINEAFASVVLAWQRELQADPLRLNPDGGAIAIGHPLGATGAILMTRLVHQLHRRGGGYGLQAMCIGHGMGTATVIEAI